jgi:hypothetical protein
VVDLLPKQPILKGNSSQLATVSCVSFFGASLSKETGALRRLRLSQQKRIDVVSFVLNSTIG